MSLHAMVAAIEMGEIAPNEKLLLIVLGNYADQAWECWPSVKRLAANTGMGPRTVTATLSKLEERGFIRRNERWRKDGSRMSNLIQLLFAPPENSAWGDDVDTAPPVKRRATPPAKSAGHDPSKESNKENHAPSGASRGTRLPDGWEADLLAATLIGLTHEEAEGQAERFKDYWLGVPGQRGRKQDWPATWRNWCRRVAEERSNGRGSPATRNAGPTDYAAERHENRVRAIVAGVEEAAHGGRRQRWRL